MLDFILSKINLLILVVALFAIISYFTFSLGNLFLSQETQRELSKYLGTVNISLNPTTYCDSKTVPLPTEFSSFGKRFRYKLQISYNTETSGENRVVFSIVDIQNPDFLFSSGSMLTTADIKLFEQSPSGFNQLGDGEKLELDPNEVPPSNSLVIVKQTVNGKQILHLFPCSVGTSSLSCEANKSVISAKMNDEEGYTFKC